MIISVDDVNYTVNAPQWGYESNINTALIVSKLLPKDYAIWDNGVANVSRTLKVNWLLTATQTGTLTDVFNDISQGRGVDCTFKLGNNSGFFPFGPDLGDTGDFGCRMISISPGPMLESPWLYFNTEVTFVMTSSPTYSLPAETSEGDLTIANTSNLRYPPSMPASSTDYGFSTQVTYDGTPYTIDKTSSCDSYHTTLGMVCNEGKAAAVINDLVVTIRDGTATMVSQSNNYLFGEEGGSNATYVCRWLNESITVVHNRHNEFAFDLSFYRVSQS